MKYLVIAAAVLAVASSQEIINQLQGSLAKLSLPEEKLAKLTEMITTTAKDCLVKAADGVTPEQSQTTIDFAMPAFHDCGDKVKEIPQDQVIPPGSFDFAVSDDGASLYFIISHSASNFEGAFYLES